MPNRITGLLIARHETQQVNAWLRADRAAMAVEREIRAAWREFLDLLAQYPSGGLIIYQLARRLFHGLPDRIRSRIRDELVAIAKWSARQTGAMMGKTLPTDYLRAASMVRVKNEKPINRLRVGTVLAGLHDWNLSHSNVNPFPGLVEEAPAPSTGIIQLAVNALGLEPTDYADPFREPARAEMTDERKREIFTRLLFPQPDQDWTNRILALVMQGQTWYQALDASMRAAEYGPDRLANIVATGYALGKSQRDIATDVLPWVDGLRWRGARVARTFGLAVAGRAQREMHEQVDDLTIGFMVRATLDERTRPAHRLRNGTVFYRQPDGSFLSKVPVPGPPGKVLREMPHPPVEGDGSLSWNCR